MNTSPQDQGARIDEPDPLVGATLGGRYLIRRLIGHGGMGSVYEAEQTGLGRRVAVKVLRSEFAPDATDLERFRREAQATALLRHPNIVKVYDFGAAPGGSPYLVMELLAGPPLNAWLRRHPRPDPARVVEIFAPVCAAVGAMHRAGIVHRDIKAANIVLPDPADPDDVVKVLDLGIVRFVDASRNADLTGPLLIGTVEYIAPEVARGGEADARSDLYALGVTAYQALTGDVPFTAESDRDVLIKHVTEAPRPPSAIRPDLPPALDGVLLRALAKDPSQRFESARHFADALRGALAGAAPAQRESSILLVDADAARAAEARGWLEEGGYRVTLASDGIDALLALGRERFDLFVTNLDLPNLDGRSLLRLAAEKNLATPAVAFAAGGAAPAGKAPAELLTLPLDRGALLGAVGRALAPRDEGRE